MIKTKDAIREARKLLGTPYAELDCINLIKAVIRKAPGGVMTYTTAGSNALWRSFNAAPKYKDLTYRQDGIDFADAGMLAFKASGEDYHHVGIVTDVGTVIHSSSTQGGRGVVETPLTAKEGWTHLASHRYIETQERGDEPQEDGVESYKAIVTLSDPGSSLNVRNDPGKGGDIINRLFDGQIVTVQAEQDGWSFVSYGDSGRSGYVASEYLAPYDEPEAEEKIETTTVVNELTGEAFMLVGKWKIAED
jgi:hypothetical protein